MIKSLAKPVTKRVHGRHGARWVALQGLYAWSLSCTPLMRIHQELTSEPIIVEPVGDKPFKIAYDKAYVQELFLAIGSRFGELDEKVAPYLDRKVEELNPIEHAILRIGTYELIERVEIPYKVVINEAILLAKIFGAQDSHKFVNGVLDKAAQALRASEVQMSII